MTHVQMQCMSVMSTAVCTAVLLYCVAPLTQVQLPLVHVLVHRGPELLDEGLVLVNQLQADGAGGGAAGGGGGGAVQALALGGATVHLAVLCRLKCSGLRGGDC